MRIVKKRSYYDRNYTLKKDVLCAKSMSPVLAHYTCAILTHVLF